MIDFHAHILPCMDDGAENIQDSLSMLRQSFRQGVHAVVATPHFYAYEEYPDEFLKRRHAAARQLEEAMLFSVEVYPNMILGAEVLYFPGISEAAEIPQLCIGTGKGILIEPPMASWSDNMLDDIACLKQNFGLTPIIAHVDRYMNILQDQTLIDRLLRRELLVQVNGSYFLNPKTRKAAFANLGSGKIHLIGSDCHDLDSRPPNLGDVRKALKARCAEAHLQQIHQNAANLLMNRRG